MKVQVKSVTIEQYFATNLHQLMGETFEDPIGIYLDKDTSLFQTLKSVSAQEASIPVGGKCASLAAQVAHVTFYIESFERYALQGDNSPRDWGLIWRTVEKVTPEEWDEYKRKLKDAYLSRPAYQQNDYIGWIARRAKREETKQNG